MDVVIHCLVATSHLVGVRKGAGRVSLPPNLGWVQPHRCCPHLLSTRCMCWGLVMGALASFWRWLWVVSDDGHHVSPCVISVLAVWQVLCCFGWSWEMGVL